MTRLTAPTPDKKLCNNECKSTARTRSQSKLTTAKRLLSSPVNTASCFLKFSLYTFSEPSGTSISEEFGSLKKALSSSDEKSDDPDEPTSSYLSPSSEEEDE